MTPTLLASAPVSSRLRIALYSHDTMGLGHVRRNLLLARGLASAATRVSTLLIAGAREAGLFTMPPGVDCLTLPAVGKQLTGEYDTRRLHVSVTDLIRLRARIIRSALEAFEPDVLIVDNVPRGVLRELDPALQDLRTRTTTRCVLGLRDVLDDPAAVRREWDRAFNEDAIRLYYDRVWVYGDPEVYRPVREYGLAADVAARVRYTGYLDQGARLAPADARARALLPSLSLPQGRLVLCLVGGGQDGARLAQMFAETRLPAGVNGVIVTGPFMAPDVQRELRARAAERSTLRVLDFVSEPALLVQQADRVIAMGGYNTVCELLSFRKHALIVPRVTPRSEQLIRAQRMHDLGVVDLLHPSEVTPQALARWIAAPNGTPALHEIDMNGLARLPHLLNELLAARPHVSGRASRSYHMESLHAVS
jgi:predicted glycosyltransferase